MDAVQALNVAVVAMDDANQSLPPSLPPCSNGTETATVYFGVAADEGKRLDRPHKPYKRFPLAELGMTEADCLADCYRRGHTWEEGGVRLYDVLDRVSCWCCRNKNLRELAAIREHLPEYWQRLVAMESVLGPMKRGGTIGEVVS